jgi:hypothetical protein
LKLQILKFLVLRKQSGTILFSWSFKFLTSLAEFSKVTSGLCYAGNIFHIALSFIFITMQQFQTVCC